MDGPVIKTPPIYFVTCQDLEWHDQSALAVPWEPRLDLGGQRTIHWILQLVHVSAQYVWILCLHWWDCILKVCAASTLMRSAFNSDTSYCQSLIWQGSPLNGRWSSDDDCQQTFNFVCQVR